MRCPQIHSYHDVRLFLSDVYSMNNSGPRKLGFRGVARKLKWPVSYLSDVIQGRRKLTVSRAIELSNYLKFDGFETERLLIMTLMQDQRANISDYFSQRMVEAFNIETYFQRTEDAAAPAPENNHLVGEEIFSDIALLAIFDLVVWRSGKVAKTEIPDFLYSFPELQKAEVLDSKLRKLESAGLIKERPDAQGFDFLDKRLFFHFDKSTAAYAGQYADNFKRMLISPEAKGWIGSGFLMLSKSDFNEFRQRYFAFRNWVVSLDARSQAGADHADCILFQFDMNLFSIVNAPNILDRALSKWGETRDPAPLPR